MVKKKVRGSPFEGLDRALKSILVSQGMQQQQLSEITGIAQSRISSYMRGDQKPGLNNLSRMMDALGISLGDLASELRQLSGDTQDELGALHQKVERLQEVVGRLVLEADS